MTYKSNRPIAAYTMAEFESLTSDNADFARGKDKKKRKSRAGMIAGIGAGLTGLGVAGRYGAAEISSRMGSKYLDKPMDKMSHQGYLKARRAAESGGAGGLLQKDIKSAKDLGTKVKNYDYKGAPGRAFDKVKAGGSRAKSAFETVVGNAQSYGAAERGSATGMKGFGKVAMGGLKGIAATNTGKLGLAGLGAAALAGGGYGIYKAMKKGKKK